MEENPKKLNVDDRVSQEEMDAELKRLEAEMLLSGSEPKSTDGFWDFLSIRFYSSTGRFGMISADPSGNREKFNKFRGSPKGWQASLGLVIFLIALFLLLKTFAYSGMKF